MRRTGPLSTYNRVILRKMHQEDLAVREISKSVLALLAAGENKLLSSFVEWSGCSR